MQFRASIILGLLLCTSQSGVFGVSLFNFWSHILPQGPKSEEISNSVTASSGEDETDCGPNNLTTTETPPKVVDFTSEEKLPRITELLNPMSWFKRTPKVNSFEINAELGTVRV